MHTTNSWPQSHGIVGAVNFRDIGGLALDNGGWTAFGKIFRSDALEYLTLQDIEILRWILDVKSVFDLRGQIEISGKYRQWTEYLDAELMCFPLAEDSNDWESFSDEDRQSLLGKRYLSYLDTASDQVIDALRLLAQYGGLRPTVVHCEAGKDRTGVFVAVLLSIIGVTRDEIVRDYVATQDNMPQILARLETQDEHKYRIGSDPPEIYLAKDDSIGFFLDEVDERYGSLLRWALDHGLQSSEVDVLGKALTTATE
jgi:protein tyrosine/serine phosphatase